MATLKKFKAIRPAAHLTSEVAALPYDVYNRMEAKAIVMENPLSFLQIDRGETLLDDSVSTYDDIVYKTAANRFQEMCDKGEFVTDSEESLYIYELERLGRVQRGIVGCVLAKEYEDGIIKKHENTREVKENDRIRHIKEVGAHTGPIFLTYKTTEKMNQLFVNAIKNAEVIFEFTSEDGVRHKGYKVSDSDSNTLIEATKDFNALYIADGHHRAASAAKVAKKLNYEGESAQFLAVMFPDEELHILDYNRVVVDLNGLSDDQFVERLKDDFDVEVSDKKVSPKQKGEFGMFMNNTWYKLSFKGRIPEDSPVEELDVSILQEFLIKPILGIEDLRTSKRIGFVGGIRGLEELEKRVNSDMKVAFSMFPTSIGELIDVSDAGLLMPPKSTWFEPKLRSGLFIHKI